MSDFEKMFAFKNSHFCTYYRENEIICIFRAFFKKNDFEMKFLLGVRFWIEKRKTRQTLTKKYNASCLDFEKIATRQICAANSTTCQILNQLFEEAS